MFYYILKYVEILMWLRSTSKCSSQIFIICIYTYSLVLLKKTQHYQIHYQFFFPRVKALFCIFTLSIQKKYICLYILYIYRFYYFYIFAYITYSIIRFPISQIKMKLDIILLKSMKFYRICRIFYICKIIFYREGEFAAKAASYKLI